MDRDRLKDVKRTEQTESRINEDFIEWMKTSGLTWLVLIMVVLVAYFLLVRWRESRANYQTSAWVEFVETGETRLPSRYIQVAQDYPDVDSVALLARIEAGHRWLEAVQASRPLDAAPGRAAALSDNDREHYLDRADEAFRAVIAKDDNSWRLALLMIRAWNGRAAVAEARGDVDQAREHYLRAASRAEKDFPDLAAQARQRAETIDQAQPGLVLPSADDLAERRAERERKPARLDDALRDVLQP